MDEKCWKIFDSDNFSLLLTSKKCASHVCRETTNTNKRLNLQKYLYLIHTRSEKAFNTGDKKKTNYHKNPAYIFNQLIFFCSFSKPSLLYYSLLI